MKLSTITSTIVGAILFMASKAVADVEFFDYPAPNAVFHTGKTVQFVVDDMPNDGDDRIFADLFTSDGRFIKTIRSWRGEHLNDEFAFSWTIDRSIKSGRYFIELYSEDDGDDDDVSRSFIFEVDAGSSRPTGGRKPVRGGAGAGRGGKGF